MWKEKHLQENTIEISVRLDEIQNVIDHNGTDAQSTVRRQAAQRHYVQSPLVLGCVDATANGTDHNVIVVGQFGQFAGLQNVNVEFVIVRNGEDDRV